jgi:hypothetical protein
VHVVYHPAIIMIWQNTKVSNSFLTDKLTKENREIAFAHFYHIIALNGKGFILTLID